MLFMIVEVFRVDSDGRTDAMPDEPGSAYSRRQLVAGAAALILAAGMRDSRGVEPQMIMMIRHGEKPTAKHQPPYGLTSDGEQDFDSLTVRGWQRAGALATLFGSAGQRPPASGLETPSVIYAARPRGMGSEGNALDGKKSKRPLETIEPLAARLGLSPDLGFAFGDEAALAAEVLTRQGPVLISWEHEKLLEIAGYIVDDHPPSPPLPQKWPGDRFDVVWVLTPPAAGGGAWNFLQVPQQLLAGDLDRGI